MTRVASLRGETATGSVPRGAFLSVCDGETQCNLGEIFFLGIGLLETRQERELLGSSLQNPTNIFWVLEIFFE